MLIKEKVDGVYEYKCTCGNTFKSKNDNRVCFNCRRVFKHADKKSDIVDCAKKLDAIMEHLLYKGDSYG